MARGKSSGFESVFGRGRHTNARPQPVTDWESVDTRVGGRLQEIYDQLADAFVTTGRCEIPLAKWRVTAAQARRVLEGINYQFGSGAARLEFSEPPEVVASLELAR